MAVNLVALEPQIQRRHEAGLGLGRVPPARAPVERAAVEVRVCGKRPVVRFRAVDLRQRLVEESARLAVLTRPYQRAAQVDLQRRRHGGRVLTVLLQPFLPVLAGLLIPLNRACEIVDRREAVAGVAGRPTGLAEIEGHKLRSDIV